MSNLVARPFSKLLAADWLLGALVVLSAAAGFYSQASAVSYADLLRAILLYYCLPQALGLGVLSLFAPRKHVIIGSIAIVASWLFVAELMARIVAV